MVCLNVCRDVELKAAVNIVQDAFARPLPRPLPVLQQQQLRQRLGPRVLRHRVRLVTTTGVLGGDGVVCFHVSQDVELKTAVNIVQDAFAGPLPLQSRLRRALEVN